MAKPALPDTTGRVAHYAHVHLYRDESNFPLFPDAATAQVVAKNYDMIYGQWRTGEVAGSANTAADTQGHLLNPSGLLRISGGGRAEADLIAGNPSLLLGLYENGTLAEGNGGVFPQFGTNVGGFAPYFPTSPSNWYRSNAPVGNFGNYPMNGLLTEAFTPPSGDPWRASIGTANGWQDWKWKYSRYLLANHPAGAGIYQLVYLDIMSPDGGAPTLTEVQNICAGYRTNLPDVHLCINSLVDGATYWTVADTRATVGLSDMQNMEQFLHSGQTTATTWPTITRWLQDVSAAVAVQKRGSQVRLGGKIFNSTLTQTLADQWRTLYAASVLIANFGACWHEFQPWGAVYPPPAGWTDNWWDEADPAKHPVLGAQLGARAEPNDANYTQAATGADCWRYDPKVPGFWWARYVNGYVFVNLSGSTQSFSLPADATDLATGQVHTASETLSVSTNHARLFQIAAVAPPGPGTTTIDTPATSAGDVLVFHGTYEQAATPVEFALPSGFTLEASNDFGASPVLHAGAALHDVTGVAEPASYDFGTPVDPPVGSAALFALHGVDTAVLAAASTASKKATSAAPNTTSVTTTRAAGAVLLLCSVQGTAVITWPAGAVEVYQNAHGSTETIGAALLPRAAAGATGALTWALDSSLPWWALAVPLDAPSGSTLSGSVAHHGHGATAITASVVTPDPAASAAHGHTSITAVVGTQAIPSPEWVLVPPNPDTNPSPFFSARSSFVADWRWQVDGGTVLVGATSATHDSLPVPGLLVGSHVVESWLVYQGREGPHASYQWNITQIASGGGPKPLILGDEPYTVWLMDRKGTARVNLLQGVGVQWARQRNGASAAKVSIPAEILPECAVLLASLTSWAYSIGLWMGDTCVWEGPLTDGNYSTGELNAADVSVYLGRRRIHQPHDDQAVDASLVVQSYVRDAMAPDPPGYTTLVAGMSGVAVTRQVPAGTRIAQGEVDEVCKVGLYYTTLRRQIRIGRSPGLVPVAVLTDSAFTTAPQVPFDGNGLVTLGVVVQQGSGAEVVEALATLPGADAAQGLHEAVVTDSASQGEAPQAEAQAATQPEIIGLSDGVLSPLAPVGVDQLIPDAVFRLALSEGARPVSGLYRLETVEGSAQPGQASQVKVTFVPA